MPATAITGASGALLPAGLEVESAVVPEDAWIAGRSWQTRSFGAAPAPRWWRSREKAKPPCIPSPDDVLQAGDVLTLVGNAQQIAAACELLRSGPSDRT